MGGTILKAKTKTISDIKHCGGPLPVPFSTSRSYPSIFASQLQPDPEMAGEALRLCRAILTGFDLRLSLPYEMEFCTVMFCDRVIHGMCTDNQGSPEQIF